MNQLATTVALVAFARSGESKDPAARVRWNAMTASTSPAALAVNLAMAVSERGVLQVGVDLFDDRVPAVGRMGSHGVRAERARSW